MLFSLPHPLTSSCYWKCMEIIAFVSCTRTSGQADAVHGTPVFVELTLVIRRWFLWRRDEAPEPDIAYRDVCESPAPLTRVPPRLSSRSPRREIASRTKRVKQFSPILCCRCPTLLSLLSQFSSVLIESSCCQLWSCCLWFTYDRVKLTTQLPAMTGLLSRTCDHSSLAGTVPRFCFWAGFVWRKLQL